MRNINTVLFDLDDTLHDDTLAFTSAALEVAREVAAEHGIDALALKEAYIAEAQGFWHRLSGDQVRAKFGNLRITMWENALSSVGLDDHQLAARTAASYRVYRRKYDALFPGALDLLRDLKSRGVKLGLLTNGFSETHREKITLLQIAEYFDALFLPDEVGMVKPDPLLFAHACTRLGSSPSQSAMVGDRYDRDIVGAIEAGLYTVWVNVRNERMPPGSGPADVIVSGITEVGERLRDLIPAPRHAT